MFSKGHDWRELTYIFKEINSTGFSEYFKVHIRFICYLLQPVYELIDKTGIFIFYFQCIANIIPCIFLFLIARKLLKDDVIAFLLALFYCLYNIFFQYLHFDGYVDYFLLIIPILYFVIEKKIKIALILLIPYLFIREDSIFISFIIPLYLFYKQKITTAFKFAIFIIFFGLLIYSISKNAFSANSIKQIPGSVLVYQSDNEKIEKNSLVGYNYSHLGSNETEILSNFYRFPITRVKELLSKKNSDFLTFFIGDILYVPLINIYWFVLNLIPLSYVLISSENSMLRIGLHKASYLPHLYLSLFMSFSILLSFAKKISSGKYNFVKPIKALIIVYLILIIFYQIPIIYKNLNLKVFQDYNKKIKLFNDLKINRPEIIKIKKLVYKETDDSKAIVVTERMHYFFFDTINSYSYGYDTLEFSENDVYVVFFNNRRFPVSHFILDYSLDRGIGAGRYKDGLLLKLIQNYKYEIFYIKYPVIALRKKKDGQNILKNANQIAEFKKLVETNN